VQSEVSGDDPFANLRMAVEIALEERQRALVEALKKELCDLGWCVDTSLRLLPIVFHKGGSIGLFGSRDFPVCHLGELPFSRAL
jgi:hypothetical protein